MCEIGAQDTGMVRGEGWRHVGRSLSHAVRKSQEIRAILNRGEDVDGHACHTPHLERSCVMVTHCVMLFSMLSKLSDE